MTYAPDQFQLEDSSDRRIKCPLSSSRSASHLPGKPSVALASHTKESSLSLRTTHRLVPCHSNSARTHSVPRKTTKRALKNRIYQMQKAGSDPSEPLSISTWLTSMKPLMTPLSPRNDGLSVEVPSNPHYGCTDKRISSSFSPRAKLSATAGSPESAPISSWPSVPFPLWMAQTSYGDRYESNCSESVLPDVSIPPMAPDCFIKSSPGSSPSREYSLVQESGGGSEPNSVVIIPTSDQDTTVDHSERNFNHSSEVSGSSCHLVKLNISSPKSNHRPVSSIPITPGNRSEVEGNGEDSTMDKGQSEEEKKRTRVTIEIETGGECNIFLPVDRVEYRVVARPCPECSDKQREKTVGRKPTVVVETKK